MKTKISAQAKKQQGFTLIELIVVIVILGILAATALPRFASLQNDARYASAKGAVGAISSAAAIAHAAWLVAGSSAATTVTLEGSTINMLNGYPDVSATGIQLAAGLTAANYQISANGTSPQTFAPIGVTTVASCSAQYATAPANGSPTITLNGASSATCN